MSPVPDLNGLATIRADHVTPKRVKWIWKGRIPAGKVTMLDGDPGLGKSTITTDLTARVTTASAFPDGDQLEKRRCVLLLSAEDSAGDTIVPRPKVAGADLRLVTILDHVVDPDGGPRQVELPADIDRIEKWCASLIYSDTLDEDSAWTTPGLVIIDPLMAFFAGEVNAHRDQDVRRVLHRLKVTTRSRPAGSSGRASAPTALRTCSVTRLSGPPQAGGGRGAAAEPTQGWGQAAGRDREGGQGQEGLVADDRAGQGRPRGDRGTPRRTGEAGRRVLLVAAAGWAAPD